MRALDDKNEKACITLRPGLHEKIKSLCKEYEIKQEFAFSTGMQNWVDGMTGTGAYMPIYQPDHADLERVLRQGRTEAVNAVRAVLAAFVDAEEG